MSSNKASAEDKLISAWERQRYVPKPGEPELPPQLSELAHKSADEILDEMNRLPFFMNELDETDGHGGTNVQLEALKSLAYEGEPDEIATNFKNQGNECFKARQYKNAVQYYTRGLDVACGVDAIDVALYVNRGACNLELKNYRRCIEDCKKALQLDENNVKAYYRAGKALFSVERYDEAKQILRFGLTKDPANAAIAATLAAIADREASVLAAQQKRELAAQQKSLESRVLAEALALRGVSVVRSSRPPELLENATLRLEDPAAYDSQLIFPAMVLYPTLDEFDFVAEISELSTPTEILGVVLDRPQAWFDDPRHKNFSLKSLDCYMETVAGGLVKVGKKATINGALMADAAKAPLFDNGLRLYVVPKADAQEWLSKWKKEDALKKRLV